MQPTRTRKTSSPRRAPVHEERFLVFGVLMLLLASLALFGWSREKRVPVRNENVPGESAVPQPPGTLQQLLALPASERAACDIGRMNLLCALGLCGADGLDVARSLASLDGVARKVEWETLQHFYRFRNQPDEFQRSEAFFRMLVLATVLQQDLGVRYNPDRMSEPGVFEPNDAFFANSADVFLHGLIGPRRMGTCSSLPVLYVAVGRRLGYPLKLVTAKCHLFVCWEDERTRVKIEATGIGFNSFEEDYYRRWPLPISDRESETFGASAMAGATENSERRGSFRDPLRQIQAPRIGFDSSSASAAHRSLTAWSSPTTARPGGLPGRIHKPPSPR